MAELINPCDDGCNIEFDVDQVIEIYNKIIVAINEDLDSYYEAGRINGATWAEMATALKTKAIDSSLNAVTQLQMKETPMDRQVKQKQIETGQEQIDSSQAKTIRDDEISDEQIDASKADTTNKTCMANAECVLKDSQKAKIDYETSDILPIQKGLVTRQTEGFDDNLRTKLFDTQMSSWAMMFSSGLIDQVPCVVTGDGATDTYNGIITGTMPSEIVAGSCFPTEMPTP